MRGPGNTRETGCGEPWGADTGGDVGGALPRGRPAAECGPMRDYRPDPKPPERIHKTAGQPAYGQKLSRNRTENGPATPHPAPQPRAASHNPEPGPRAGGPGQPPPHQLGRPRRRAPGHRAQPRQLVHLPPPSPSPSSSTNTRPTGRHHRPGTTRHPGGQQLDDDHQGDELGGASGPVALRVAPLARSTPPPATAPYSPAQPPKERPARRPARGPSPPNPSTLRDRHPRTSPSSATCGEPARRNRHAGPSSSAGLDVDHRRAEGAARRPVAAPLARSPTGPAPRRHTPLTGPPDGPVAAPLKTSRVGPPPNRTSTSTRRAPTELLTRTRRPAPPQQPAELGPSRRPGNSEPISRTRMRTHISQKVGPVGPPPPFENKTAGQTP